MCIYLSDRCSAIVVEERLGERNRCDHFLPYLIYVVKVNIYLQGNCYEVIKVPFLSLDNKVDLIPNGSDTHGKSKL